MNIDAIARKFAARPVRDVTPREPAAIRFAAWFWRYGIWMMAGACFALGVYLPWIW